MKKFTLLDAATIGLCLIPVMYLIAIYPTLPATVPLHYDINGKANGFGDKSQLFMLLAIMQGASIGTYFLMRNLKYIDPKKHAQYGDALYNKIGFGTTIFITAISMVILYTTKENGIKINKILFPLIGLLFAFIGNMMNNIKPNYFAGIRTPWTLEDEGTWKATHRIGAKIWVIGGLLISVATLLLPGDVSAIVFPCAIGVMTVVPIAYSYIYYKRHRVIEE